MKKLSFVLAGSLLVLSCREKPAVAESVTAAPMEEGVILAVEGDVMPTGMVVVSEFKMAMEGGKLHMTMPDQEIEGTHSMDESKKRKVEAIGERTYRYTIVEERKAEQTTIMEQEQPVIWDISPLEEHAVIAEMSADGTWTARLEIGEATPEKESAMAKIVDELKEDADLKVYGTAPRMVGDEWEVNGSNLLGVAGADGVVRVKFEGIEDFQGERCAKITGTLDLVAQPGDEIPETITMRMTGDFVVFRSLEHLTDLQNTLTGKMEISGYLEHQPGVKISTTMIGPLEFVGTSVVSVTK